LDSFLQEFAETLLVAGPAYSFLFAFLETVWLTGVVIPTGPVVIFSTALASEAGSPIWPIWVAMVVGGGLGDSIHFWIGHRAGDRTIEVRGPLGRSIARNEPRARAMFERHPSVAVSMARLISFVRTLTPRIAGMTDLSYRRFLLFDALGLLGWSLLYVGIGVFAGESWQRVSSGVGLGLTLLFLSVGALAWKRVRTRRGARQATIAVEDDVDP